MKSYLDLIPISAGVRKRQNRMTIVCILISVLLVTAIFGVADMFIRTESDSLQKKHGNWHLKTDAITKEQAEEIGQRADVMALGSAAVFNEDADQPYFIGDRKATLYAADSVYLTRLTEAMEEGAYPESAREAVLSANAKLALDVGIGDTVTVQTPSGSGEFVISGFGSDESDYYQGQTYLVAVYLMPEAFEALMAQNGVQCKTTYYMQFESAAKAAEAAPELSAEYGIAETAFLENTALMGISGQSDNASVKNVYGMAAILFVLVLLAGSLMISGSMNSNVSQRVQFFGMLRCIGAGRRQIIRFVRMEALNWCKTAVPAGLICGTLVSQGICALLRYGIGGEFSTMPVFALSPVGLCCGAVVGVVTVLLAAQAPAVYAAKISPVAAVSGTGTVPVASGRGCRAELGRIELTLGVHHAAASRKNRILMTASFALSIILLLCFSVGLEFAYELLPSLRPWQPDITLGGYANAPVIAQETADGIGAVPGVGQVWGSSYLEGIPAASYAGNIDHVNLVAYDAALMEIVKDNVVQGDLTEICGSSDRVMIVPGKDNPLHVGDTVEVAGETLRITCAVSDGIYPCEYSIICSQETFARLTGNRELSLLGIRLDGTATEETVREIGRAAQGDIIFSDLRERNQEDRTTYRAVQFLVYSFLGIIAMISLFNIINSISMSVTARTKQYGAMRAVGMDGGQITRMIFAEAFTYAASGFIVGCGIGLLLHRFLYQRLITRYFGVAWSFPAAGCGIIAVFMALCVLLAVRNPSRRLRRLAVTETINEL